MRALKMAGGMLLMVISVISFFPMLALHVPHAFWICAGGFVLGLWISWYYRHHKES